MTFEHLVKLVGMRNARILQRRYNQQQAGLNAALAANKDHVRRPNKAGKPKTVYSQPDSFDGDSFLDRMKKIEQEFQSGTRKRKGE